MKPATPRHSFSTRPLHHLFLTVALITLPAAVWGSPRMESVWSSNPVGPGKEFHLTITARWNGDAGEYVIQTPVIEFPEEILIESVSSTSFQQGEDKGISYRWDLVAKDKGHFQHFPVKINVFSAGEPEPVEKELSTEPLVVDVARWHGIPVTIVLLSAGATLALLALLGWVVRKKRTLPPGETSTEQTDPALLLNGLKEELNTCRVRGDTLSFLETAQKIHGLVSSGETPAAKEVSALLDQARYGNLRLSGEEMERWYRKYKKTEISGKDAEDGAALESKKQQEAPDG